MGGGTFKTGWGMVCGSDNWVNLIHEPKRAKPDRKSCRMKKKKEKHAKKLKTTNIPLYKRD